MLTHFELSAVDVPHIDQYFGIWAIHEARFRSMVDRFNGIDLRAHVARASHAGSIGGDEFESAEGVAVIELSGVLMKFVSSLSGGTSTVHARRQIRSAMNDSSVEAILLRVDSPGGTVAGTKDLADDVRTAASKKPVYAFIEDLGASGAYWVASQASKVFATETTLVGSIGTFAVLQDSTGAATQMGLKVHIIKAGSFKGMGVPGTEVTAEHLEEAQRLVNELNSFFLEGVRTARNISGPNMEKLADGRVYLAAEAVENKLIDGVQTFDQTLQQLSDAGNMTRPSSASAAAPQTQPTTKEIPIMDPKTNTAEGVPPVAASATELKSEFPDSSADFRLRCIEQGWSMEQAKGACLVESAATIKAKDAEIEQLKAAAGKPGLEAVSDRTSGGDGEGGSAAERVEALVAVQVKLGKPSHEAYAKVMEDNPDLREAFVAEHNEKYSRRGRMK